MILHWKFYNIWVKPLSPSLPAEKPHCSMPLCLGSLLSLHSLIALHWALVSVWPTSSRASALRGPAGARKEATPAARVSQAAHNTVVFPLQLAALPPLSPRPACLFPRQGPTCLWSSWGAEKCQYWLLIWPSSTSTTPNFTLCSSRLLLPEQETRSSCTEVVMD